jgi:DNA-3-methyladenine glycosylase I
MEAYHDLEWGTPLHDDRALFELLTLEGAQAGLSWSTVLYRRDGYRQAFANFDPQAVAKFGNADAERLFADTGIIRNRQKITSTILNAQQVLKAQAEHGSFDAFLWSFVDGKPIVNSPESLADLPGQTPLSVRMSKSLQKAGFSFVGPTICYALMQSAGLINDHLLSCPRRAELLQR